MGHIIVISNVASNTANSVLAIIVITLHVCGSHPKLEHEKGTCK